jgi:polyisoprenoid-binding protein YceI
MISKVWITLAAVSFLATHALAAKWSVDPTQSRLLFAADDSGTRFTGTFKTWTAAIDFDAAHLDASSFEVSVDTKSVDAKDPVRNQEILGPDWLNVASYPTAHFVAKKLSLGESGGYQAIGTLKIRNIEKTIRLLFTVSANGNTIHAKGAVTLKRTDFDLGLHRGEEWVALPVEVSFEIVATVVQE